MKKTIPFSRFDAELNTDVCDHRNNAELTLKLRLGFRQINPAGGAASGTYNDYGRSSGTARKILKWDNAAWSQWKRTFERQCEQFWSGKFWLINPAAFFSYEDRGKTWIPNIWCRFDLIPREGSAGNNHHTIDVVRLDPSESFFGSHSTLYDSKDINLVQKKTDSSGNPIMQRASVHEVGHLLGLGHVAEGTKACPSSGNTNASACYGTTDSDMNAVMGGGMQLRLSNASPWQSTIRRFAAEDAVQTASNPIQGLISSAGAVLQNWDAKMSRHYPRTPDEVRARTLVTTRGAGS